MVQSGTSGLAAYMSIWHSMHDVRVGMITLACPPNPVIDDDVISTMSISRPRKIQVQDKDTPSVPPSIRGLIVVQSSGSTKPTTRELIHRRASMLSSPHMMIANWR